jgi:hypothetical protein
MTPRPLRIASLALGGVVAASSASGLGFGRIPDSVAFGQALDVSVPLRLEAGEGLAPGCLQAEVRVGEQRVPPGALAVSLEGQGDRAQVRLRSALVVREPLVEVRLSAGCDGTVSRRFMLFADPADGRSGPPSKPGVDELPAAARPPLRAVAAGTEAQQAGAQAVRAVRQDGPAPSPLKAAGERAGPRALGGAPAGVESAGPRLQIDDPQNLLRAAAAVVAAQDAARSAAAPAASAAEAAAASVAQRVAQLETRLKQVHEEADAQRAAMESMRSRLVQADEPARWQGLLLGLLALLCAALLWLGWRLRSLRREQQAAWWRGAAAAHAAEAAVQAEAPPQVAPPDLPIVPGAGPPDPEAVAARHEMPPAVMQRTNLLPPQAQDRNFLDQPVSVDDLIDLEQQVDFFLVLGEQESAVDLLASHLRSTGGACPLPYLKLLEIYRGNRDCEAYERTCERFSQRFDAPAPGWEADPGQGRDLVSYPQVLNSLQQLWTQPLAAMAELEALLLRKRPEPPFDLPAYRDVLTLYSVARDLHRRADDRVADVDVLLPLDESGDGTGGPPSIVDDHEGQPAPTFTAVARPTAPVDLDLSEPVAAAPAALRPA